MQRYSFFLLFIALFVSACGPKNDLPSFAKTVAAGGEPTEVFWGDTHLHTNYSPDAYFFGNTTADPDTAYRYAKGLPVVHPHTRAKIQIHTALDFLVVADHAEMMGVPLRLFQGDERLTKTATGQRFMKMVEAGKGQAVFLDFVARINSNEPYADLEDTGVKTSIWSEPRSRSTRPTTHSKPFRQPRRESPRCGARSPRRASLLCSRNRGRGSLC